MGIENKRKFSDEQEVVEAFGRKRRKEREKREKF